MSKIVQKLQQNLKLNPQQILEQNIIQLSVFNLEKRGKELVENFYDYYRSGQAFNEPRWDDCHIFDVLTEKLKVSNGPLSIATGAPQNFESIIDHHKGEWKNVRTKRKGI